MLVMHEPMKTSSIGVFCTSDRNLASSGSLGQHRIGSLISFRSTLNDFGIFGVGVRLQQFTIGDPVFHLLATALDACACRL